MKNRNVTATASLTLRQTSRGPVLLVSVITPDACEFRSYRHDPGQTVDAVIAQALRSCGVPQAYTWALLPTDQPLRLPPGILDGQENDG